jgi:hypothetical protein
MFLRADKRLTAGKDHTDYALVDSQRMPDGPRQGTVADLGELHQDQERRGQGTVVFYQRHGDAQQRRLVPDDEDVALPDDPDSVRIRRKQVGWTNGRRGGDVWLAWQLGRMLHLDVIVPRHVPPSKHTCRPADIVASAVLNRLCAPCSAFALAEHW